MQSFQKASFGDIPEFGVGHATDTSAMTGCTAFVARGIARDGAVCGVDVRGGAPATRETDLLRPENMVQKVNAVIIGGGSAYGLEASCGAMTELASLGLGFEFGGTFVPIVSAACLFDLMIGKPAWPDSKMGAEAVRNAIELDSNHIEQGSVGAGTGATVGKLGGPDMAMKAGFGVSGLKAGELVVISCVAVNALGNVIGPDGNYIAGVRSSDGQIIDPLGLMASMMAEPATEDRHSDGILPDSETMPDSESIDEPSPVSNTTLGVVLTNADFSKAQATKVAQISQDAFARTIYPAHSTNDGDTIFCMASGMVKAEVDTVAIMAELAMREAIWSAIDNA